MSSRPIANLEKIFASINFREDEVIVTPEPTLVIGPVERQVLVPYAPPVVATQEMESDSSSEGSESSRSSEDVPLTVELLTPTVRSNIVFGPSFGFREYTSDGEMETSDGGQRANRRWPPQNRRQIQNSNQRQGALQKRRKNGLPFKLPAASESLLEYDSTSDGIDVYQEREREARRLVRQKRKSKKRRCDEEDDDEERKVKRRGASFH